MNPALEKQLLDAIQICLKKELETFGNSKLSTNSPDKKAEFLHALSKFTVPEHEFIKFLAESGIIDLMSSLSATEPKVEHAEQDAKAKRGIRFGIKSMFLGKKKGEEDKMSRTSSHGSLEKNPPSGSNTKLWKSDDVLNDEPKRETSPTKSGPSEPQSKETEMPTEEDHKEEMESKVPEMLGESAYELSIPLKSNLNESQRTIIGARSIDTVSPTKGELPKIASRPQVRASSDDVRKSGNTSGPPSPVRSEQELAHYNKNRPKPKRMQSTPIDEVSHPAETRADHAEKSSSVDKNDSPRSESPQNMSPSSLSKPAQERADDQKVADSVQPVSEPPNIVSTPSQLLDSHPPSITARQVGGANAALASIMMQDFKRKSEGLKDLPAITRRPDGAAARPMSYHPGLSSEKVPIKAPRPVSVSFDKSESSVLLPEQSEALPAIDSAPHLASPEVETTFKGKEELYREELAQKARLAASAEHKKAPVTVQPAASVLQFKKKINSTSGDDHAQEKVAIEWLNNHLKGTDKQVTDLTESLKDGLCLIFAMENVTGEKVAKYNKKVFLPVHKLDNLTIALQLMSKHGIDTTSLNAQDILSGDKRKILSLFNSLLLKFNSD